MYFAVRLLEANVSVDYQQNGCCKGGLAVLRCGVDIVEIERVRRCLENPRFLARCFTEGERVLLASRRHPAETAAGIWAAKEAFVKALGTGFCGVGFQDISVLRDRRGKPVLSLSPRAQALAGGGAIDVSISHDRTQAVAFVVML